MSIAISSFAGVTTFRDTINTRSFDAVRWNLEIVPPAGLVTQWTLKVDCSRLNDNDNDNRVFSFLGTSTAINAAHDALVELMQMYSVGDPAHLTLWDTEQLVDYQTGFTGTKCTYPKA